MAFGDFREHSLTNSVAKKPAKFRIQIEEYTHLSRATFYSFTKKKSCFIVKMGQEITPAQTGDEIQTHEEDYIVITPDEIDDHDRFDRCLASVVRERARQRGMRIRAATDRIRNFRPTKSKLSVCTYGCVEA